MSKVRIQQYRLLIIFSAVALLALWASTSSAAPADQFKDVKIISQEVAPGLYLLTGAGGNIAASIGADGTLIVDDQFAPLAKRILRELSRLDGEQPKLVLNTHYHGDHTGSNAIFGQTGTIIAHTNVRVRLLGDDQLTGSALPTVTFDDRLRLHFNGDAIDLIHLPAGHTDGDAVVWFRNANVIHLGDHYFRDRFPYIDLDAGGSVEGVIHNLETVLRLVPGDIQVIPGHGALANLEDLQQTLNMLRATRSAVTTALANGTSAQAILTAGLDAKWDSWGTGFINEEQWIRTLLKNAGVANP